MVLSYSSVCACLRPETLLTRYLAEYLTHFHQTYTNELYYRKRNALKFGGQKVTVQGHGTVTVQAEAYRSPRLVSSYTLSLWPPANYADRRPFCSTAVV